MGRVGKTVLLLILVATAFSAQEIYERPWEQPGWVASNPYIIDYGVWQQWYTVTVNLSFGESQSVISTFSPSLAQLELEELYPKSTGKAGSEKLGEALQHKMWAENFERALDGELELEHEWWMLAYPISGMQYTWIAINYVDNWKKAMGYSLEALEAEAAAHNQKRSLLGNEMEWFMDNGVCEPEYGGPGAGYCYMVVDDINCSSDGMWGHVPDMEWYSGCMRGLWDSAPRIEGKLANISEEKEGMLLQLEELRGDTSKVKGAADAMMQTLEGHSLEKIYLSGVGKELGDVEGISDQYEGLNTAHQVATELWGAASGGRRSTNQAGWYATQYENLLGAYLGFTEITESGEELIDEAEEVVEEQELKVLKELVDAESVVAEGEGSQTYLTKAQTFCHKAEGRSALGDKFRDYQECEYYAKKAQEPSGDDIETDILLEEVEGLITKAKKDNIDVGWESAVVDFLKEKKIADKAPTLRGLKESILEKAELAYLRLPENRSAAITLIGAGGEDWAFMKSWLVGENCFYGNDLDYSCGIGKLKEMGEAYNQIFERAEKERKGLVESALYITVEDETTYADIWNASTYFLTVGIKNPLGLGGENVAIEINTPAEIAGIDVVEGGERIRVVMWERGEATIQLDRVVAGEELLLRFETEYFPCRMTSSSTTAVGLGDGAASVVENMRVECSTEVDGIYVGDVDSVKIDGASISALEGYAPKKLSEGAHYLERKWKEWSAYGMRKEMEYINTVGAVTVVEYNLLLEPRMDLDVVPVEIDEQDKNPQKIDVCGFTGEKITNKHFFGNGGVYFEVNDLVEGKECKVRIKYEFSNEENIVRMKIADYSKQDLTNEQDRYLSDAINASLIGDFDLAMENIERIESSIEKENREWDSLLEKDAKSRKEVEEKIADLFSGLEKAGELNITGSYVGEIEARVGSLNKSLEQELASGMLQSPLSEVDMGWEGKKLKEMEKELKKRENEVKARWMEMGVDDGEMLRLIAEMEEKIAAFVGAPTFNHAFEAFGVVAGVEERASYLEGKEQDAKEEEEGELVDAISSARTVLQDYEREEGSVPEGHWLDTVFKKSPSWISKRLTDLGKEDNVRSVVQETEALEDEMWRALDFLEAEDERSSRIVESAFEELNDELGEDIKNEVQTALNRAASYASNGEHVKSILLLEDAMMKMEGGVEEDVTLVLMALTALFVLGIVSVLLLKGDGRGEFPRLPFMGKKSRGYKRLKRAD